MAIFNSYVSLPEGMCASEAMSKLDEVLKAEPGSSRVDGDFLGIYL